MTHVFMTLSAELKQQVEQDITWSMEKVVEEQVMQALEAVKGKGNIKDAELRALYLRWRPNWWESLHSLVSKWWIESDNIWEIIEKVTTEKNKLIAYVKEKSLTEGQNNTLSSKLFWLAWIDDIQKNSRTTNIIRWAIEELLSIPDMAMMIWESVSIAWIINWIKNFSLSWTLWALWEGRDAFSFNDFIQQIIEDYNPDLSTKEWEVALWRLAVFGVTALIPWLAGTKVMNWLRAAGKTMKQGAKNIAKKWVNAVNWEMDNVGKKITNAHIDFLETQSNKLRKQRDTADDATRKILEKKIADIEAKTQRLKKNHGWSWSRPEWAWKKHSEWNARWSEIPQNTKEQPKTASRTNTVEENIKAREEIIRQKREANPNDPDLVLLEKELLVFKNKLAKMKWQEAAQIAKQSWQELQKILPEWQKIDWLVVYKPWELLPAVITKPPSNLPAIIKNPWIVDDVIWDAGKQATKPTLLARVKDATWAIVFVWLPLVLTRTGDEAVDAMLVAWLKQSLEEAWPNREEALTKTKEEIKIWSDIIQFEKWWTKITEAMQTEINKQMQWFVDELQRRQRATPPEDITDMKIVLTWFASWDGGNKVTNEKLAKARAEAMKKYLQTAFPILTNDFFTDITWKWQETPVDGKTAKEYQSVHIDASWDKKAQVIDQDHKGRRERFMGKEVKTKEPLVYTAKSMIFSASKISETFETKDKSEVTIQIEGWKMWFVIDGNVFLLSSLGSWVDSIKTDWVKSITQKSDGSIEVCTGTDPQKCITLSIDSFDAIIRSLKDDQIKDDQIVEAEKKITDVSVKVDGTDQTVAFTFTNQKTA